MKKGFLTIAAICAMACCFSACELTPAGADGETCEKLNEMLAADYSEVTLTVRNTFDEDTFLESKYVISYLDEGAAVTYSVERFSEIGDGFDAVADVKKTLSGTAVISDGEVVSVVGDDIGLSASITERGLDFKESYFADVESGDMYFEATVKDADAFMGTQLDCSGMTVSATFLDLFYMIRIEYTSANGSSVMWRYDFNL